MSVYRSQLDQLLWSRREAQANLQAAQEGYRTCAPEHRQLYTQFVGNHVTRLQAIIDQIAEELRPRRGLTVAEWQRKHGLKPIPDRHTGAVPRDGVQAERMASDGDEGALGRVWDAEVRRERFYQQ